MPTYDYHCSGCDRYVEVWKRISARLNPETCATCGMEMVQHLLGAPALVGAMPSKPIDFTKQIGRKFETNKEFERYTQAEGVHVIDKTDSSMVRKRDARRELAEQRAKKAGYRDARHRIAEIKRKAQADNT